MSAPIEPVPVPLPQQSLAPTTTEQDDISKAGQRKVNLIWEYSQAFIALLVVVSNMIVGVYWGLAGLNGNIPVVLSNTLFLIVGFYFSRTNHQAIGGIGKKATDEQEYKGR